MEYSAWQEGPWFENEVVTIAPGMDPLALKENNIYIFFSSLFQAGMDVLVAVYGRAPREL